MPTCNSPPPPGCGTNRDAQKCGIITHRPDEAGRAAVALRISAAIRPDRFQPAAPLRRPEFWLFFAAPPLLLMGAIYWLGTDRASASHTHSWLHTFLQQFFRASVGAGVLDALNVGVRKSGHFLGYALLGLLNCRALRAAGLPPRRAALLGWTAAAAWAAVDEYHQSFSPSRGATVEDVFLDSCGAATGIFLYSLWIRTRKPSA